MTPALHPLRERKAGFPSCRAGLRRDQLPQGEIVCHAASARFLSIFISGSTDGPAYGENE
jgi:hypothetical protein